MVFCDCSMNVGLSFEKKKKKFALCCTNWWNRPHYLHIFLFTHSALFDKIKVPCDHVICINHVI